MIELFNALTTDPTVNALVKTRVYPNVAQQGCDRPFVVYTVINAELQNSMLGFTGGLQNFVVQVDCYSTDFDEVQNLADAVQDLLGTARTVVGLKGFRGNRSEDYEDDTRLHRVSMDFTLWKEA
jgi:hypothetical protein